jgi:hypothetical protein
MESGGELSRKLRPTAGCDAKEEEEELNNIWEKYITCILYETLE